MQLFEDVEDGGVGGGHAFILAGGAAVADGAVPAPGKAPGDSLTQIERASGDEFHEIRPWD